MATNQKKKFDQKKIEESLRNENRFISNLFSLLALPQNEHDNNEDSDAEIVSQQPLPIVNKTSRAKSLVELQNRINKLTKKGNTYKEKIQKRNLKNKLKKKIKREKRSTIQKGNKPDKVDDKIKVKTQETQPVFNKDDKIIFSKIDFAGLDNKKHKKTSNPKKILDDVRQTNDKVQKLKEQGEIEKATEIKSKTSWKNALARAEGIKVKDDPVLLKKSIQKLEQKKRSSKKKWENRIE
ncbi:hypothetical protein AMK59_4378, partial [Oryctes borbonicus]